MEILRAVNLKKYYGRGENLVRAVDDITFSIEKGSFTAIVGTSGSGKTTLLNLLGGLDYADSGEVIIDGYPILKMKEEELTIFRRRNIGFVFQNYNLISVQNVYKNIVLPIRLVGQVSQPVIRRATAKSGDCKSDCSETGGAAGG